MAALSRIASDDSRAPAPVAVAASHPRMETELGYAAAEGLRPAARAVGYLFIAFAIYNWLQHPPGVRVLVVTYNVAMAVLGFAMHNIVSRKPLSLRGVHIAAAVLSFAVAGNILFETLLEVNPLFSFYMAVLLIASAGSVMSWRWAVMLGSVEIAGWMIIAAIKLPLAALVDHAFLMASSAAVAVIVHVGRDRARARIIELRSGDARRELALQHALAEADEARRGLDRKVEERTAALRTELIERQRLEEQLRHAQKMEAVGRLAGGIAHDFNNLLTVIRMSLLTVSEPGMSEADVSDALRDASDATDRAAALTHDLLAFARKQTLERAAVAVSDVLGGVERMVRRVVEASIKLEVEIAPDVGEIIADRHQIDQVLLNIAINACDAMGTRGTLRLTGDSVELNAAEAQRRNLRPGAYVRMAVSDTGTGMDEVTLRSIFEPFFTTKEVGRGTGLGLAVAHGIVTQHHGQIDVVSEVGKGSTFTVYLPRSRGTLHTGSIVALRPQAPAGHETLLVVEDEPAVRRAVHRNLERLGYHVLSAQDGEDALKLAETIPRIDLLLTDVVMPGIDGPELACRLRARWSDLPVMFVTGYSADRLARTDALGPHDRVLEKPYQLEELARTIRSMMSRTSRVSA